MKTIQKLKKGNIWTKISFFNSLTVKLFFCVIALQLFIGNLTGRSEEDESPADFSLLSWIIMIIASSLLSAADAMGHLDVNLQHEKPGKGDVGLLSAADAMAPLDVNLLHEKAGKSDIENFIDELISDDIALLPLENSSHKAKPTSKNKTYCPKPITSCFKFISTPKFSRYFTLALALPPHMFDYLSALIFFWYWVKPKNFSNTYNILVQVGFGVFSFLGSLAEVRTIKKNMEVEAGEIDLKLISPINSAPGEHAHHSAGWLTKFNGLMEALSIFASVYVFFASFIDQNDKEKNFSLPAEIISPILTFIITCLSTYFHYHTNAHHESDSSLAHSKSGLIRPLSCGQQSIFRVHNISHVAGWVSPAKSCLRFFGVTKNLSLLARIAISAGLTIFGRAFTHAESTVCKTNAVYHFSKS